MVNLLVGIHLYSKGTMLFVQEGGLKPPEQKSERTVTLPFKHKDKSRSDVVGVTITNRYFSKRCQDKRNVSNLTLDEIPWIDFIVKTFR